MGMLGKILVMINGVFALMFLMWGVTLYTNRVSWFTDKSAGKETIGLVDKYAAQYKVRQEALSRAVTRWERNFFGTQGLPGIKTLEEERFAAREFYRDNLNRVRDGKDTQGKAPGIYVIRRSETNPTRIDQKSKEEYRVGPEPLRNIVAYTQTIADRRKEIQVQQTEVAKLIKEYEALTLEMFGTEMQKGLRTLIKEQEAVAKSARSATEFLIPLYTDRDAQKDIFDQRNEALQARLKELNKYLGKPETKLENGQ
jgi:hypothetical protein